MKSANQLLKNLDFGMIDSESETNLDAKFLKTSDFEQFIKPEISLILGAKGSGKSALFEMFSRYEKESRKLAGNKVDNVLFVTGTGFKDLKELTTDDIQKLMDEPDFDFSATWQLYIAIKVALKLGELGYVSGENLSEFLRQSNKITDYRILPIIRSLWGLIMGTPPKGIDVEIKGFKIKIGDKNKIDVQDILLEMDNLMEQEEINCWVLFDKIDELFSNNYEKRKLCIESLFRVYLLFIHQYPHIKLKIFLRDDIWKTLQFVNKSHLSDKCITLEWDINSLMALMIKRACMNNDIEKYICNMLNLNKLEILNKENLERVFYTIFEDQVYKGTKEAKVIDWMIARITDGLGGKYPRELINFGNISACIQIKSYQQQNKFLICGKAIRDAYYEVSDIKCSTYLSEFPLLQKHFERFSGFKKPSFKREELIELMNNLEPNGNEMIKQLYEVGIILPIGRKPAISAEKFEVPRLFRAGLGMALRGRP